MKINKEENILSISRFRSMTIRSHNSSISRDIKQKPRHLIFAQEKILPRASLDYRPALTAMLCFNYRPPNCRTPHFGLMLFSGISIRRARKPRVGPRAGESIRGGSRAGLGGNSRDNVANSSRMNYRQLCPKFWLTNLHVSFLLNK